MRAQTSLPALGIALVLLVTTSVFAVTVAAEQLEASRSETLERAGAVAVADALIGADSEATVRANVLDRAALRSLSPAALEARYGLDPRAGVRVQLGTETVLRRGSVGAGTTIERIVLIENRSRRTIVPTFRQSGQVTLPRRTPTVTLRVRPDNATVETVRVNGRIVLDNPTGLRGRFEVSTSRFETATIGFAGSGRLSSGDVRVTYWPARTRKSRLRVTIQRGGAAGG